MAFERNTSVSLGSTLLRRIASWVFCVLTALTLLATPLRSSFHLRSGFVCEADAPLERWVAGALNWAHLISYGVLMLAGNVAFREHRVAKAGALVFALSAVVELEQAVFTVGHCRVRDLLPNLFAVALVGAGMILFPRAARRSAQRGERAMLAASNGCRRR
jgi:hypothetical protein